MTKQTLHPAHCRCPKCNPPHPGRSRRVQTALAFGPALIGLGGLAAFLFLS